MTDTFLEHNLKLNLIEDKFPKDKGKFDIEIVEAINSPLTTHLRYWLKNK